MTPAEMEKMRQWAKQLILELQGKGNFDEFNDDRESDGINADAVDMISDYFQSVQRETAKKILEITDGHVSEKIKGEIEKEFSIE